MQQNESPLVVITGAAGGIGGASVKRFLAEGFRVAAIDLETEAFAQLPALAGPERLALYPCDLAHNDNVRLCAQAILQDLGEVHTLLNVAGIYYCGSIVDLVDESWEESFRINLLATAILAREFVPGMKSINGAAIVNVSSRNALSSSPHSSPYDAAKAGMLALTRSMAVELGEWGIRVNAVCPGVTETPMTAVSLQDENFVQNYLKLIPLGRFGQPEDIANTIYFLASKEAAFITGQYIIADGGQLAGQNHKKLFDID